MSSPNGALGVEWFTKTLCTAQSWRGGMDVYVSKEESSYTLLEGAWTCTEILIVCLKGKIALLSPTVLIDGHPLCRCPV